MSNKKDYFSKWKENYPIMMIYKNWTINIGKIENSLIILNEQRLNIKSFSISEFLEESNVVRFCFSLSLYNQ